MSEEPHRRDLRSVFMTVGDAVIHSVQYRHFRVPDTLASSVFNAANFESQRLPQDGTTIDPSHGLRLEEDPVAHFVILPNYEEGETVLRETLENLGCFS